MIRNTTVHEDVGCCCNGYAFSVMYQIHDAVELNITLANVGFQQSICCSNVNLKVGAICTGKRISRRGCLTFSVQLMSLLVCLLPVAKKARGGGGYMFLSSCVTKNTKLRGSAFSSAFTPTFSIGVDWEHCSSHLNGQSKHTRSAPHTEVTSPNFQAWSTRGDWTICSLPTALSQDCLFWDLV